jgi:predicted aspartyl protease
MPALSGQFNRSIGPLINIGVLPSGVLTPTPGQTMQVTAFPALLDTGASVTCISPNVAQTVGLQPIGMRPMISATHTVPAPVYLVDLVLPFGVAGFVLSGAQVMEFSPTGSSAFQMLVGRDIICQGLLTMSFDGHFSFAM